MYESDACWAWGKESQDRHVIGRDPSASGPEAGGATRGDTRAAGIAAVATSASSMSSCRSNHAWRGGKPGGGRRGTERRRIGVRLARDTAKLCRRPAAQALHLRAKDSACQCQRHGATQPAWLQRLDGRSRCGMSQTPCAGSWLR
jgi:hypothetical protein